MNNNSQQNLGINSKVNEEEGFDAKTFFAKLRSSWKVFIISLVVCGIFGALFMHYKAPVYNIEAKVLIDDNDGNASSSASSSSTSLLDLSSLLDIKSNVDNEVVVYQTRRLVAETVADMNLNIIYYLRRYITDQQINRNPIIAQILKPVDTIVTTTFKVFLVDSNRYYIKYKETDPLGNTTNRSGIYYYGQAYNVAGVGLIRVLRNHKFGWGNESYRFDVENPDQRIYELQQLFLFSSTSTTTTTIDLVFNYPIANEGESILTHLINRYLKQNVLMQNMVADSTIKFVNKQLMITREQLQDVERRMQNFKQDNKLADLNAQGQLLLNTSNTYMTDLDQNQTELSIIKSLQDYLKDESKTVVPVSVLPTDPEFATLVDTYNSLIIERDKQSLTVTKDNPFMQNIEDRIATLRADMLKNLSTTKQALDITNQHLKSTTGGFSNQLAAIPPLQKQYIDLQRELEVDQSLYTYLLQKLAATQMSKASNLSIATVIDESKADFKPYSPNIILVVVVALFMGLFFPVARIFVKDMLNRKILIKDDITKNTSVPIIGEISHNKSHNNLIAINGGRSAIAEQFRSLRTNLQFFINKDNEKVILITSSVSGEGKSFTTSSLAGILAISGKKVLLMELDLRKPKLSNYFGIENVNGFSNYIVTEGMAIPSIVTSSVFHENLFIISSGPVPPNPAELISDPKADYLMTELRKQFDYIIIDAPPIGIVADAQILNRFTDMTLYIVRQNFTLKDQLKIVEDLYQNKKMNKIALIVNDIENKGGYGYGYSYGYNYGYGYGYGYYQDDNDRRSKISQIWNKIIPKKKH